MKVLLLTPTTSFSERYGSLSGAGSSTPALGILLLAAVARKNGHIVSVIDASAREMTLDKAMDNILSFAPDVVGISMTTLGVSSSALLADRIKKEFPGVFIIVGGPHISAAPKETKERFTSFDVAVIGEGEETFLELLDALYNKRRLDQINGICFKESDTIKTTPRRAFIKELDMLPFPAWDMLEGFPEHYLPAPFKVKKLPAASLVSSRGCPNKCIFCDRSVFGSACHGFSAKYVIDMILDLYNNYGIRHINFEDDTFITFKPRMEAICRRLIELDLKISWSCLGRVNHINMENLSLMKQAGCWQISYGIESGSQDILNSIKKNITIEQIRHAVILTHRAGILSKGFFIVGHPGETLETLHQTEEFAMELPLDDISVTMLTPFPGTEIYERAEEFGKFDRNWTKLNLLNAVFVPHGLKQAELEKTQQRIIKRFYLRPRIIANYLRRMISTPQTILAIGKAFISFIRSVF